MASHEIAQNAILLPPAKFNAIPTSRRMISTSAFLLCALISGLRESAKKAIDICSTLLWDTFFRLKLISVYENEMKHKDGINVTSTGTGDQFISLNILWKSFAEVSTFIWVTRSP